MSLILELRFRSVYSCFLSCGISTLLLVLMVFLQHIGFCAPWFWITDTFLNLFVTSKVFLLLLNIIVISLTTLMFRARLSVTDRVFRNTYQICGAFFIWSDFKILFSSMILGAINSLVVAKLLATEKYGSFFEYNHFPSVNQRALTLTACGAFMGLLFCITVLVMNKLTLNYSYPVGNIFVITKEHMFTRLLTTVGRVLYFLPLYAVCPNPFWHPQWLSFIWLILDIRLIILILITTFHLQFSWSCAIDVLKSQFQKPIEIPLFSDLDPSNSVQGVLGACANPLGQHLALERLADLVATNQNVRSSIFSLSHLGGRPILWRQISNLCFQLIEQFVSSAHESNTRGTNLLSTPLWPKNIDFKYRQYLPSSFESNLRQRNSVKVKQLSATNGNVSGMQPSGSIIARNLINVGRTLLSKLYTRLSRTQLFSILSPEIPYASTAHLFSTATDIEHADDLDIDRPLARTSGQVIIWATEILACLTLAAYNEDQFGSVQQSLGRILLLFVDGLEAVEKHLRFVGLLSTQYKQSVNYPVPDSSYTSTMLSAGHLQTPLRSSKRLSGDSFLPNDLCKLTYYRFASDASLPWRVYATFCWALTNCLSQYDGCFATLSLDNKSKERLQLLKSSCCTMKENLS
ncbi:ADP-ribosylation factor protein 1, variant 3 [Schistosoma haematobium]|uniref:ADP-ribosylation factor protein 1, variant 3 n=2 Tax=Schistosoma haematobium TaxID=6185 RepID=A0A922LNQ6_SCHHA|nr:ADP-ribosylation factor protein 1, variant 3 [Schistosoma haematobium]KAH9590573.1 ADP-ribosylation factor protein 1, variant 3 [Schistosoma haematobium]CAH8658788.1 unnamed protein product [Schistosoma haematobium]